VTADTTPVPDPTILTTEALARGLSAERDYVDGQISILEQRLDAIDKATELLNETVNRVPTDVQQAVGNLRELVEEQLKSVQTQFRERDTRQERESRDNKLAVDAAFAAQEKQAAAQNKSNAEAQTKSEAAIKESIDKQSELFQTTTKAITDKVDDLKDTTARDLAAAASSRADLSTRITALEQQKVGAGESRTGLYAALAAFGVIVTIIVVVATIIASGGTP